VVVPFVVDPQAPAGLSLWRVGSGYWSCPAMRWVSEWDPSACIRGVSSNDSRPGFPPIPSGYVCCLHKSSYDAQDAIQENSGRSRTRKRSQAVGWRGAYQGSLRQQIDSRGHCDSG